MFIRLFFLKEVRMLLGWTEPKTTMWSLFFFLVLDRNPAVTLPSLCQSHNASFTPFVVEYRLSSCVVFSSTDVLYHKAVEDILNSRVCK